MPMDHKRPVDMRQVIARIVDDSDFTEFGAELRPAPPCAATPASRARPIGIITNNGPIDVPGANKATHFIQACCQSRTPIALPATTPPATWSARPTRRPA